MHVLIVSLSVAALAACASDTTTKSLPSADEWQQAVFTGQFVDGLPVYRLPSIVVVGSRSLLTPW